MVKSWWKGIPAGRCFCFISTLPFTATCFLKIISKTGEKMSPSPLLHNTNTPTHLFGCVCGNMCSGWFRDTRLCQASAHALTVLLPAASQDKLLKNNHSPFHEHCNCKSLTSNFLQILSSTWGIVTLHLHGLIEIGQWTNTGVESAWQRGLLHNLCFLGNTRKLNISSFKTDSLRKH